MDTIINKSLANHSGHLLKFNMKRQPKTSARHFSGDISSIESVEDLLNFHLGIGRNTVREHDRIVLNVNC